MKSDKTKLKAAKFSVVKQSAYEEEKGETPRRKRRRLSVAALTQSPRKLTAFLCNQRKNRQVRLTTKRAAGFSEEMRIF